MSEPWILWFLYVVIGLVWSVIRHTHKESLADHLAHQWLWPLSLVVHVLKGLK